MTNIEEIEELKECPFCGGKAFLKISDDVFGVGYKQVRVGCKKCHCSTELCNTGKTVGFKGYPSRDISLEEAKNKAVSLWNKRIFE